jgi:predicted DNA-binding transcriptional regulator AlpA
MDPRTTTEPCELLSRAEASALTGISCETLRRWYAEARGPATVKLGTSRQSRVRYPRAALLEWAQDPTGFTKPARQPGVPRFTPPARGRRAAT